MKFLQQRLGSYGLTETSLDCKNNRFHLAALERRSVIFCTGSTPAVNILAGSTRVVRQRKWQPPNPGEYKTNFDGAMSGFG